MSFLVFEFHRISLTPPLTSPQITLLEFPLLLFFENNPHYFDIERVFLTQNEEKYPAGPLTESSSDLLREDGFYEPHEQGESQPARSIF